MSNLLIVALNQGIADPFIRSLRATGWQVYATSDVLHARQLLQEGHIEAVVILFNPFAGSAQQLNVLRSVQELCPRAMVVMLNAPIADGVKLVGTVNAMNDAAKEASAEIESIHLSPAQKRIAELVAEAHPNREISRRLKIKEQSVRNELSRIFKKLNVRNRVELALWMREGRPETPGVEPAKGGSPESKWPGEMKPPIVAAAAESSTLLT
jgi:DNA-binding CsgD family transcriptional regulator